jgi:hypothetical protein
MTTFTSEDRILAETPKEPTWHEKWGRDWTNAIEKNWNNQTSIEYFWPLTEQIGLNLDYSGCAKQPVGITVTSGTTGLTWVAPTATITPQLCVEPISAVGHLAIGGIRLGLEKKPNLLQRVLHKLLGFDWKDK